MSATRCQNCAAPLPAHATFCGVCGHTNTLEDYQPDEQTARSNSGKTQADHYATTFERPNPADVVSRILTVPLNELDAPKDAFATLAASGELLDYPEHPTTAPPGGIEASGWVGDDPYSAALQRAERDALAAHPTSPLHLEEDDDDEDDRILFLPGQFADAQAPQRGIHRQPEMPRAEHLQPGTPRAEHLQPGMQRGEHLQPTMQRAAHVQAQTPHFQLGSIIGQRRAKPASPVQNILIGIGALVVTGLIILSLLPLFQSSKTTGPALALVNATSAFPGGSVHLHGSHFTPGSSVVFYLDGVATAQADPDTPAHIPAYTPAHISTTPPRQMGVGLGVALLALQAHQYVFNAEAITQADGTFDASIIIPQDWQINTTHDIMATERGSGQKALARVTVVDHAPSPSLPIPTEQPQVTPAPQLVGTPTTSPRQNPVAQSTPNAGQNSPVIPTQGPVPTAVPPCPQVGSTTLTFSAVAGGTAPNAQALTISNGPGCGAGNWSVNADAAWLTLDKSGGTFSANGTDSVNVGVSIATLKAGTYTGHIRLSPGTDTTTVSLTIQLPPPCITTTTGTLTFSSPLNGTAPSQVATIANGANCSPGTWTVASDAAWLLVKGGGTIDTGASANATVDIATAGLTTGNYTGHLTFNANGSSPATTTVTLTIQSHPCITADTTKLGFTGDASTGANPAPGTIIITNCGDPGTVTAGTVTDNGINWLNVTGGGALDAGAQTKFMVQPMLFTNDRVLILPPGATYTATITVTITTADGHTKTLPIAVSFTVIRGGIS
ncbi:MAG: hypothetical protein NVS4B9_29020 [Ktedonobacteraceae bacterium]